MCVVIMKLKLALFLEDEYIQQTQKTVKGGQKITFKIAKLLDVKDNQCLDSSYAVHVLKKHKHIVTMYEVEDYDIAIASDSYSSEAKDDPCEKHPKIDLGDSLQ